MNSNNKNDKNTLKVNKGVEQPSMVNPTLSDIKIAAEIMKAYDVHTCTDVTGFGLMGHLKEMTIGSHCDVTIEFEKVPYLREVKITIV